MRHNMRDGCAEKPTDGAKKLSGHAPRVPQIVAATPRNLIVSSTFPKSSTVEVPEAYLHLLSYPQKSLSSLLQQVLDVG